MKLEPAQPGIPQFPLPGSVPFRSQPPAMLFLNAIGFRADPAVPENLNRFFGVAGPMLIERETIFFATMVNVRDLVATYAFDILFWGELRDRGAFDEIHTDPAFIEAALQFRNPSLRALSEEGARVATELSD